MNIDQIEKHLSTLKGLSAWEITEIDSTRHEAYLIFDDVESLRKVTTTRYRVTLYVVYTREGQNVQGESTIILSEGDDIPARLNKALEMAGVVANEPFILPQPPLSYSSIEMVDEEVKRDPKTTLSKIREDLVNALEKDIRMSSSETFVTHRSLRLINSLGLDKSREETELFVDFVLLAGREGQEAESQGMKHARFYEDLKIEQMVHTYSTYARDALPAQIPPSGQYDVVLSEEALDTFFKYFAAQAGGTAAYQGWSSFKEGDPIMPSPVSGETLTMTSNPLIPGGMKSMAFDDNGLPCKPVTVIKQNRFQQRTSNKRYADYLKLEPTGDFANIQIQPGQRSLQELLSSGSLVHLLRFSTFEPNPVTGAFSGEIRTGYLIKDGVAMPIKGGSLSGTMRDALHDIYFSRETVQRSAYLGPMGVRVNNLHIAGD
jgi:PmbA protein